MDLTKPALILVLCLTLAGCATAKKDAAGLEVQQLKTRIDELETQLQQKNEEINYLENQLESTEREKAISPKEGLRTKVSTFKRTNKNIQLALKNAGLYNGTIDGQIGKGTKKAIKEFQQQQGLRVDGIVGKETWLKLKKYL